MPDERASLAELLSHGQRIRQFFSRRVQDEFEADDLTQETLFSAWKAFSSFRRESSLSTWLYGIAKRVLWRYYRSKSVKPVVLGLDDELASWDPDADSERVSGLALSIALGSLSRDDAVLYDRFYRQRICIRKIAAQSGEPEGTVKYRLFRLRATLREGVC